MSDIVYLLVDGKKIDRFTSYTIDADLYAAGDAFTLELAVPEVGIRTGLECQLYVNNALELHGIIDKVVASYDKSGRKLTVTGRDLMGWLVDACTEEFISLPEDMTLVDLIQQLLTNAPDEFFELKMITYSENDPGRLKTRGARVGSSDTPEPPSHIEPGMKVFEVISAYAKSKGLLFYLTPDGNFVLGKPKETDATEFTLTNRKNGRGNNVLSGEKSEDISRRYSKVIVVGQKQGKAGDSAGQWNIDPDSIEDESFPFYKPFVHKDEHGGNPKQQARMLMDKMRYDGFRLNYTVAGHSQGSKNWCINELAHVIDEDADFQLNGAYLIYGRTFEKSKDRGTTTKLRLGLPGMIA